MNVIRNQPRRCAVLLVALAILAAAVAVAPIGAQAAPAVRGISGNTIAVAGLGNAKIFADAGIGAQARFARANRTHELKGYTIDFKEFADDKADPGSALSETRRLVTQSGIFALVPDVSQLTPGDYLTQQQVPWFGPGYDSTYCGTGDKIWGFSWEGCVIPSTATKLPNIVATLLKKELAKKGITTPTIALQGTDSSSGRTSIRNFASTYTGAGWKVVYAKASIPDATPVGDYSPYAQAILTSNNGKAPDVVYSQAPAAGSLQLFNLIKTSGYGGTFLSPYYSNILLKPLQGSYVFLGFAAYESDSPAMTQMKNDIKAVKPDAQYTLTMGGGYLAADHFLAVLKKVGKNITPAAVQKAAAHMTYQLKDVVGPVNYPASFHFGIPNCATLLLDADATAFQVAEPYTCSAKTYPILQKFAGS
jgi:ABC-type branched-subunit amino acid transport system substrate-binding protein